jgi:DNA helicase IV
MRSSLTQLDDYSVRSLPLNTISFAEIKHFKGLENEVVIVIDLPHPDQLNNTQGRVGHYVALTRARSLLVVIWRGVR